MSSEGLPHRLSIIGYWSTGPDQPEQSRGYPDPHDLVADWDPHILKATLARLAKGKVFRGFLGMSSCRMCDKTLGTSELTDGVWAWPEGLDHYVETHRVKLPTDFVASLADVSPPSWLASLEPELWVETCPGSASPVDTARVPACTLDENAWLDWAAANTPARPQADAVSLDEAHELCRRLSHATWTAHLDEVMGRWRIRSGDWKVYLQKCSARSLERCLLRLRPPDQANILDPERANAIATEYDGSWGAVRMVIAATNAWLVWVKGPDGEWPTQEDLDEEVGRQHSFGYVTFHIRRRSRSFSTLPPDETGWRWLVASLRDETTLQPVRVEDEGTKSEETPPAMSGESHGRQGGGNRALYIIPMAIAGLFLLGRLASFDVRDVTTGEVFRLFAVAAALGIVYWLVFWRSRGNRGG